MVAQHQARWGCARPFFRDAFRTSILTAAAKRPTASSSHSGPTKNDRSSPLPEETHLAETKWPQSGDAVSRISFIAERYAVLNEPARLGGLSDVYACVDVIGGGARVAVKLLRESLEN